MNRDYHVMLYYGYEENECGIFHSFEAVDLNGEIDSEEMRRSLAESLDIDHDDNRFNFGSMEVKIPKSVVAKITADALRSYGIDPTKNHWRANK